MGEPGAERRDPGYRDVVLERWLRKALARLNPELPPGAAEDAFRKLTLVDAPSLLERNRATHRMLVDGVTVEYRRDPRAIYQPAFPGSRSFPGRCSPTSRTMERASGCPATTIRDRAGSAWSGMRTPYSKAEVSPGFTKLVAEPAAAVSPTA